MKSGSEVVRQSGKNTLFNILSMRTDGMDCRLEGQHYTLEQCREKYKELCRTVGLGSRTLMVRTSKANGDIDIMS